ncbi:MAG: hypothetical protein KBF17_05495 [Candidatus Promineofilum sp.]|nr:hypothetical protein [Promineifilum sp.]MBP9657748.1 hypothetical protein [Promineifilum sp.]
MQLIINGFLTDYQSRIFLQKTANESLAPVGRSVEPGILPTQTLARAFREETGLIVMPIRLTGIYHSGRDGGRLTFCYRCTMRGGVLQVPEGYPPAGFFDFSPLPRGLSPGYRQQVDEALHHAGGSPSMKHEASDPGVWLGRLVKRAKPVTDSMAWNVAVQLVDAVDSDAVEMTLVDQDAEPAVDAVAVKPGEAPWDTAARLLDASRASRNKPLVRLVHVTFATERPAATFVFAPVS